MPDAPATPPQSTLALNMTEGQFQAILAAAGGIAITHGVMSASDWQQYSGLAAMVFPLLWSAYSHWRINQSTKAQVVSAYNTGIVVADATQGPTPRAVEIEHVADAVKAVAAAASTVTSALPPPSALAAAAAASQQAAPVASTGPEPMAGKPIT